MSLLINPYRFAAVGGGAGGFADTMTAIGWSAWWRLGETSGTVAADATGNGRSMNHFNGVTVGATSLVAGDANKAASYSGASQWSYLDNPTWLNVSSFSLFGIFKPATTSGNRTLASQYDGSSASTSRWTLRADGTLLKLYIASGATFSAITLGTIAAGTTYSVGFTWSGSVAKGYLNGINTATSGALAMNSNSTRLNLGGNTGAAQAIEFYSGVLDEFAIKAGAVLTDSDMSTLHAAAFAA